jgi:hypothetical protein
MYWNVDGRLNVVLTCFIAAKRYKCIFNFVWTMQMYEELGGRAVSALGMRSRKLKKATAPVSLASLGMGDQKFIISSSSVLRKAR